MKTFKDLIFKPLGLGFQAKMDFENGYGVSVIYGFGAFAGDGQYEVAIIFEDDLCYNTYITDDVIGYQSLEDVTEIMKKVQEL